MSLSPVTRLKVACSFPRVSGDEPAALVGVATNEEFSPRERG